MSEINPSLLQRKIIHFDMDAFYASVEMREDPSLHDKPVVVGGSPNSRGVVSTANYEARKYGVRSAMSSSQAVRLCPNAVFIRPNFEKYLATSKKIREVFRKYTSFIEPMSLDEAYLDVTNNQFGLYAVKIAKLIQDEIRETLQLTGSAGVAPNKLLAKIASDIRKPNGITVVLPHQVESFMASLSLRKIHGIGPVTEKRLGEAGLRVCRDVWQFSVADLERKVGNIAGWLYERSRGLDDRPVVTNTRRKSLGREETFAKDIISVEALLAELDILVSRVVTDLKDKALKGRTITLKVRYDNFQRITRSLTLPQPTCKAEGIRKIAGDLLLETEAGQRKIRLLGISLGNLE